MRKSKKEKFHPLQTDRGRLPQDEIVHLLLDRVNLNHSRKGWTPVASLSNDPSLRSRIGFSSKVEDMISVQQFSTTTPEAMMDGQLLLRFLLPLFPTSPPYLPNRPKTATQVSLRPPPYPKTLDKLALHLLIELQLPLNPPPTQPTNPKLVEVDSPTEFQHHLQQHRHQHPSSHQDLRSLTSQQQDLLFPTSRPTKIESLSPQLPRRREVEVERALQLILRIGQHLKGRTTEEDLIDDSLLHLQQTTVVESAEEQDLLLASDTKPTSLLLSLIPTAPRRGIARHQQIAIFPSLSVVD